MIYNKKLLIQFSLTTLKYEYVKDLWTESLVWGTAQGLFEAHTFFFIFLNSIICLFLECDLASEVWSLNENRRRLFSFYILSNELSLYRFFFFQLCILLSQHALGTIPRCFYLLVTFTVDRNLFVFVLWFFELNYSISLCLLRTAL